MKRLIPLWPLRPLRFFLLAWLSAASVCVSAATFPEKPPETDFYVDAAGLIAREDGARINELALKLLGERQIPVYVVTIESLSMYEAGGQSIESYAQQLFDHWGIGFDDFNYGILLLVSQGDRKARIELGADYGGDFDPAAQRIMNRLIIPHFKDGKFSLGILDGVRGLDAMARGERLPQRTAPAWVLPAMIIGAIFLLVLIFNLFRSGRSGWAWALIIAVATILFFVIRASANSGSSGGFGGGSSGGGGATGSW